MGTLTTRRSKHSPPRPANDEALAVVKTLDYFEQLPTIPGPKGWSDDVERAATYACLNASPPAMALCAAGVPHRTAHEWLSDDPPEAYRSACVALTARLKQAEQACASELFGLIKTAAKDPRYWTAAAWTLERKHGYVVQNTGFGGPATVVNIGQMIVQATPEKSLPNRQPIIDAEVVPAQNLVTSASE